LTLFSILAGEGIALFTFCQLASAYRKEVVMFRVRSRGLPSYRAHLEEVKRRLPEAHREALAAGADHLHDRAAGAAADVGWEPGAALSWGWHHNEPHLMVAQTKEGDALFDHEFGTETTPPHPVIRTAVHEAMPEARRIYTETLSRQAGLL